MDDVAVAARARTRSESTDAAGFDAFVTAHGSRLLRTAFLLTGEHGAAEDLLQDTFVRAWSRWSRVAGADEPLAYVRRMLVNGSVSRWRALRSRPGERLVAEAPEGVAPAHREHDDEMWQLVATLAPRQRAVVVLGYYEDLTDGQVAEALGCATGTVKSQRAKALRTLRARLSEEQT